MVYSKNMLVYLLCFFFLITTQAQNKNKHLDSLLTIAKQTKNDSSKLRQYNKIGFGYIFNDTKKASIVLKQAIQLAKDVEFNYGLAELTNTNGILMDVTGKSDSAKYYFTEALKLSQKHQFKQIETMCINNLGMFNWNRGNYDDALSYFFQSLKMYEEENDEKSTGVSLNNIGLIYQEMNLSEKALSYHNRALVVREKYKLENEQIASLNNIGINLLDLNRIEEAILVFKKGISLANKNHNLIEYYRLLDNLANAYNVKGSKDLALKTYLKALDKPQDFDADEKAELSTLNNIANLYNEKSEPNKALTYLNKASKLVEKYPDIELLATDLYLTRAESNYMLNNYNEARINKKKFIVLKDSIFSESNAKAIANLEIKYETEKKEKEILVQRANLAEQSLTIQKRDYQIMGLGLLALVVALLGYLFYNQQKLKNQQLQKENELKDALLKIETQNRLQEQRLRISRDLHDNIGAQLTFIISSIDNLEYGFKINDDNLKNKLSSISEFTKDTIYELRDTIWAMNKNEITLVDLESRISNFIDKADLASGNTKFLFKTENEQINHIKLSSIEGMNIYRIIQEGVNNAIKYAEASQISVIISHEAKKLKMVILDDGKGYDNNKVEFGNGINNIKKRAADLNAEVLFTSQEGKGTQVILYKEIKNQEA